MKPDERIVFFNTYAWLTDDAKTWNIRIHAWVHELENAAIRRAAIGVALRARYGLQTTTETAANFKRRARLIAAGNERGKRIVIELCGKSVELPESKPNGHAWAQIQLDEEVVREHTIDDELRYRAILPVGDTREFTGLIHLIPPLGMSVISDFDDTVKLTNASDRSKMLDHTLYQDFVAVPKMSDVYNAWAHYGTSFHFVSSSPWHLYEPFEEFLDENGFPQRTMSLKSFRFRDTSLMNLFRKGTATKPAQIGPILAAYRKRRFLLVGDSGQHDPEVYAAIAKKYPTQIERIYIRNVTNASRDDERFRAVFADIDGVKWKLFDDPAELFSEAIFRESGSDK